MLESSKTCSMKVLGYRFRDLSLDRTLPVTVEVKIVVRFHPKRCDTPSLRAASCWEVTHSKDLCWESSE